MRLVATLMKMTNDQLANMPTGFLDKNGQEILSGDYVQYWFDDPAVTWTDYVDKDYSSDQWMLFNLDSEGGSIPITYTSQSKRKICR